MGAFQGTIQGEVSFWVDQKTLISLHKLSDEADKLAACYTDIASRGHMVSPDLYPEIIKVIAGKCENVNKTDSADAFKLAEAEAQALMTEEARDEGEDLLPRTKSVIARLWS